MKSTIVCLMAAVNGADGTDKQNDILTRWDTGRGGIIEIYKVGDKLNGKLVASDDPNRKDTKNPDKASRDNTLIGSDILSGFENAKANEWENGKIYNPEDGKHYKATIKLKGDTLLVHGYVGIALLGKTVEWKRAKKP